MGEREAARLGALARAPAGAFVAVAWSKEGSDLAIFMVFDFEAGDHVLVGVGSFLTKRAGRMCWSRWRYWQWPQMKQ